MVNATHSALTRWLRLTKLETLALSAEPTIEEAYGRAFAIDMDKDGEHIEMLTVIRAPEAVPVRR